MPETPPSRARRTTASCSPSNFGSWRWQWESIRPRRGLISGAESCFFFFDDGGVELLEQRLWLGERTAGGRRLKPPAGIAERRLVAQVAMECLAGERQVGRERHV